MITQKPSENGAGGSGEERPAWDFRLDRTGLEVRAGRHLRLHVSLALLLWFIAAAAGLGVFHGEWPPVA